MIIDFSDEKLVNAINSRDSLLLKLIDEADNLAVPATTRKLIMDFSQAYIIAHSMIRDSYLRVISSNKRLITRVNELEDKICEFEYSARDVESFLEEKC
jgi:hypothetical protein